MSGRIATQKEIDDLIQAIDDAFQNVGRGVSWSEARVIDDYGTQEQRNAARDRDKDTNWRQVARDPNWVIDLRWSFLDPLGFRYYVAAGMTKCLLERLPHEQYLEFQFRLESNFDKKKWSEFTEEQMRVASEFVLVMSRLTADPWCREYWRKTYEKWWQRMHDRPPRKKSKKR